MKPKFDNLIVHEFNLFDRDHFKIVKGISMLAAIIAYFCAVFYGIPNLRWIGHVASVVFVLCSGYGVSESYIRKRGLVHYWENKMIKVWIPSLVVLVVFSIINNKNGVQWMVKYPTGLKGSVLLLIFGGYAAFWLIFHLFDKRIARTIALFVISVMAFFFIPDGESVRNLVLAFPLGVLCSQYGWKRIIRNYTWKGKTVLVLACSAVAALTWILASYLEIAYLEELLWGISYTAIAAGLLFVTYFAQEISIFGLFAPIGFISYALYLIYDEVFALLTKPVQWRMAAIIFMILFASATAFAWLRELLIRWNRDARRKNKTRLKGSM